MQIWAHETILSIYLNEQQAWFFDRAGRPFAAWDKGWFIRHGLSGRHVARRWREEQREFRTLEGCEIDQLHIAGREHLVEATLALRQGRGDLVMRASSSLDLDAWLWKAITFNTENDVRQYKQVYRQVGILPPDQYDACVVQIAEGCEWNRCGFCSFYRLEPHALKSEFQIDQHIAALSGFFGEGLSRRRSIFLGEANALAQPVESLRKALNTMERELVSRVPDFRGFYSFIEPSKSACRTASDFRVLAAAGLKRVYYGVETGNAELRGQLGKPSSLDQIAESIRHAKQAGVRAGLIFLLGAGGRSWMERHREDSVEFLKGLPLEEHDLIFISPLHPSTDSDPNALHTDELDQEMRRWRLAIPPPLRSAPYDVREFVY